MNEGLKRNRAHSPTPTVVSYKALEMVPFSSDRAPADTPGNQLWEQQLVRDQEKENPVQRLEPVL